MSYDLILKNGVFIQADGRFCGSVGIKDGKIAACSLLPLEEQGAQSYDLKGKNVLPGVVDMHVHVNDPGRSAWEDWPHATAAAAAGGVTTIADMPLNSMPAVTDTVSLANKQICADGRAYVDYVLWGGLTNENASCLPAMQRAGVTAFKAFMSGSGIPDFSSAQQEALLAGLHTTVGTECFIGVHAENDAVSAPLAQALQQAGRIDPLAWAQSRPVECETSAIEQFLNLVQISGGNGHICHVSTVEGVQLICAAQEKGLPITFETCASYLTFTEEDLAQRGALLKCAPPLRSAANREALWELLKAGSIPIVTSDHSPCTAELKAAGGENIWAAWGGISGIQTTLFTMLTEGCHKRGLSLERLVQVCCVNPAKRLGLEGVKGCIQEGADADLVVIDPNRWWVLTKEQLHTKNKISPLINSSFCGSVEATFLRGQCIYSDGTLCGAPSGRNCLYHYDKRGETL